MFSGFHSLHARRLGLAPKPSSTAATAATITKVGSLAAATASAAAVVVAALPKSPFAQLTSLPGRALARPALVTSPLTDPNARTDKSATVEEPRGTVDSTAAAAVGRETSGSVVVPALSAASPGANAGVASTSQFDSAFESAMKAVSDCSTEQLCSVYLKGRSAAPAAAAATVAKPQKTAEEGEASSAAATAAPTAAPACAEKQRRGRKRNAGAMDDQEPPVDFQFSSGTWIECIECKKWRHEPGIPEPCRVPERWRCADSSDPLQSDCDLPELTEYFYSQGSNFALSNKYVSGSLVWARVLGHPFWPAVVEVDPQYGTFFELAAETNDVTTYHVTFLGRPATRAWVADARVRPFAGLDDLAELAGLGKGAAPRPGSPADAAVRRLAEEAAGALELGFQERLVRFGFFAGGRKPASAAADSGKRAAAKRHRDRGASHKKAADTKKVNGERRKNKKPKTAANGDDDSAGEEAESASVMDDQTAADQLPPAGPANGADTLVAARDRFRRRVSQLCQMRNCGGDDDGEGESESGGADGGDDE